LRIGTNTRRNKTNTVRNQCREGRIQLKTLYDDFFNPRTITMTAAEFRSIMKTNGFVDKDSKVTRRRSNQNWMDYEFEVTTRRCMNIGNLIQIEKKYGLGLLFVKPVENGQMLVIFGRVVPRT
jgi:hypothetical protein